MTPKEINIKLVDWDSTCGDGCCYNYGTTLSIDGVELTDYAENIGESIRLVLEHLGYKVNIQIETDYEDTEGESGGIS